MKVSKKVVGVEYAIRDIVLAARKVEQSGMKVDYLNIGDPVQFGFQPPDNVKQALINSIIKGENYYSSSEGLLELRQEIAKKENAKGLSITADDVLITNGVSEGLDMVISSIVEEGDEVLLPGPYYPPYASYVRLHGGVPVEFSVDLNSSTPNFDDIKSKITSKTVAICLISPNNPTGVVFNEKALKEFVNIANEHNLYIICDEIYDQIVFDHKFVGIGKVAGDSPVIILNGFSKVHLMSGWRIGYIAFNKSPQLEALREHLPKLARVRIATSLPVQHAALESLRGSQNYINDFVVEIKKHRDFVVKRLNEMPGLSCSNPQGAFYAFPKIENNRFSSDKEFVTKLLESKGVLTVHGSGFGEQYGSGHFRLVYLANMEILDSAMNKIEEFVS
ncbi:MAG: aminotransferase class I/II-fold pyridoxal phosphate-dependent enzyme [Candidatus Nitrosopumilus limneticus]|nr:Aminotransferase [Candidatus Nitrosopumilus limneticus]MSS86665.1 aminotransferase class I/II-fold pyridoxal phosphate-dependent enzyme [Nitrosopumilus sp.]PHY04794.1 MAG: alanine aminotransferase [Nitrososphaerota archaeon]MDC4212814.1 aminotransferase class I/II-fold pyridoxal phosphate-dependent enzyme [Candidatus Nitrosopumilus limneticus]MDC4214962.1 aminotransferase class I/II-fold pyridoxal phosphate-dependent enzyme [Candidatus Nitrosopumilus limneticus]